MQSGYDSLVALPGIGISMADALYESGFYSAEEVSNSSAEDLIQVRGIGEEKARKLIAAAQAAVQAAAQAEKLQQELAEKTEALETDTAEPLSGAELENDKTDSAESDELTGNESQIAKIHTEESDEAAGEATQSAQTDAEDR